MIKMRRMAKGQKGFTLIELMVVVVIIGILAAIAIPLYTGYVKRAKINEAKHGIEAIKTGVIAYVQKNSVWPAACANAAAIKATLGAVVDATKWTYATTATGAITATGTAAAGSGLTGGTVTLTPTAAGAGGVADPTGITWAWTAGGGLTVDDL